MFSEKEVEKEAKYKGRWKKKKLSPGKEFQEREVPKAGKLRRKITESTTFSAFLEDDYFHPKFVWKDSRYSTVQGDEYGLGTGSEPISIIY